MKKLSIFILSGFFLFACTKDKVPNKADSKINEHFLILMLDDSLETAVEYHLNPFQLENDSITFIRDHVSEGNYSYVYSKFKPTNDILFWTYQNKIQFTENELTSNQLNILEDSISLDKSKIQADIQINNSEIDFIWSKISNLTILKEYKDAKPTNKIAISHIVVQQYDENLGFTIPVQKYLVFLVK